MKHYTKILSTGLFALVLVVFLCGTGFSGEMMSITGTITADNQVVADDGQIYSVADTDNGKDLLQNVDKKVEIKGTVSEKEGMKEIMVESFKVVE